MAKYTGKQIKELFERDLIELVGLDNKKLDVFDFQAHIRDMDLVSFKNVNQYNLL